MIPNKKRLYMRNIYENASLQNRNFIIATPPVKKDVFINMKQSSEWIIELNDEEYCQLSVTNAQMITFLKCSDEWNAGDAFNISNIAIQELENNFKKYIFNVHRIPNYKKEISHV
jgi:hypothetical protein